MSDADEAKRWKIVFSIISRWIISFLGKSMKRIGIFVEFSLNLLSLNGGITGFIINLITGKVAKPRRNSANFISIIGHLDGRIDLLERDNLNHFLTNESKALMDLCVMASKLAYENRHVIQNVVLDHWKMHFVGFYNGWNDFQKKSSTQLFILCDKVHDADLILISFRGTEPFNPDDWNTDLDYSWYEIPELGKVHIGFLEALGLGNRIQISSFEEHLSVSNLPIETPYPDYPENEVHATSTESDSHSNSSREEFCCNGQDRKLESTSAYYIVKKILKRLLNENKRAKFVVTGHSLGGALAVLLPMVLLLHEEEVMQKLMCVYTFGQPRVGDMKLGKFMEAHLCHPVRKYFRVVYCNDLIPRLPYDNKVFLYKHFGSCLYYNSFYVEQVVKEEPNRNYFDIRYVFSLYLNAMWELIRSFLGGSLYGGEYMENWFSIVFRLVGLVIPGLSSHSPVNYINSVRLRKHRLQKSSI